MVPYTLLEQTHFYFSKIALNCNSFERLSQINFHFLESEFTRLTPKVTTYRKCKRFDENVFLNDLHKPDIIKLEEENSESSYSLISNEFLEVVNKYAPSRRKF